MGTFKLVCRDVIEALRPLPPNLFHGALCDPPYGLSKNGSAGGFMGKKWDARVPGVEYWAEVLRVLKPGAPILAFGGSRTYHRLACAIEDAGFEIFDSILGTAWVYGQGFSKGRNLGCRCQDGGNALEYSHAKETDGRAQGHGANQLCSLREPVVEAEGLGTTGSLSDVLTDMRGEDASQGTGKALAQGQSGVVTRDRGTVAQEHARIKESSVERRELHRTREGLSDDSHAGAPAGEDERIRPGAHTGSGDDSRACSASGRGSTPHRSQQDEQQAGESEGVRQSPRALGNGATRRCEICGGIKGFEGYNTSLKPAWESIVFARKPLSGTYAENCIEHGCGGLNIDGARIAGPKPDTTRGAGGKHGRYGPLGAQGRIEDDGRGRYPANLILSHHPDCSPLGTRRVPPRGGDIKPNSKGAGPRSNQVYGQDASDRGEWTAYKGEDGLEEVEAWECHPECPVAALDRQSGERGGGFGRAGGNVEHAAFGGGMQNRGNEFGYGDKGGASRFFHQSAWAPSELRYASKVSTAERNAGLPTGRTNGHATLKPLALTTYLAKLILPPPHINSRLLVPFCGTGSEVAGALIAGWSHVVGIDNDPESIDTAQFRIPGLIARGTGTK